MAAPGSDEFVTKLVEACNQVSFYCLRVLQSIVEIKQEEGFLSFFLSNFCIIVSFTGGRVWFSSYFTDTLTILTHEICPLTSR